MKINRRPIARISSIRLTVPLRVFIFRLCLVVQLLLVEVKMKRRKNRERERERKNEEREDDGSRCTSGTFAFRIPVRFVSESTGDPADHAFSIVSRSVVYRWCGRAPNNSCTRRGIVCIGTVRHGPVCFRCLFLQIPHSTDTESDQTRVTKCRGYEGGGEEKKPLGWILSAIRRGDK